MPISEDPDKNEIKSETTDESTTIKPVAKFNSMDSYGVLAILLLCRIMVHWHRKVLNYAYGYTGIGTTANNPIYEIATAYP